MLHRAVGKPRNIYPVTGCAVYLTNTNHEKFSTNLRFNIHEKYPLYGILGDLETFKYGWGKSASTKKWNIINIVNVHRTYFWAEHQENAVEDSSVWTQIINCWRVLLLYFQWEIKLIILQRHSIYYQMWWLLHPLVLLIKVELLTKLVNKVKMCHWIFTERLTLEDMVWISYIVWCLLSKTMTRITVFTQLHTRASASAYADEDLIIEELRKGEECLNTYLEVHLCAKFKNIKPNISCQLNKKLFEWLKIKKANAEISVLFAKIHGHKV